ncbi:MAG: MFS transporter [Rhodomicrobium sp.]
MVDLSSARERLAESRNTVSRHNQNKRALELAGSPQSRRALDWMNFFLADVQTGFGTFVAFYLAGLGWSQESVGEALTAGRLSGALALLPGGALADKTRWKRALAAAGILMIAGAALIFALRPTFTFVFIAEILHGVSGGIVGPPIAAISLGIVGRRCLSVRIGRNNRFSGAGNALTALLLGLLGTYIAKSSIFFATAALTIPTLLFLRRIRSEEIDYIRARNAVKETEPPRLNNILAVFRNSQVLWFAGCLALFQLADASLLVLASERIGRGRGAESSLIVSGLIVAPEIVTAFLAPWVAYFSELWGRKPLLLAGFGAEVIRAVLFAFITSPIAEIFVQLLDGISGATLTVLTVVVAGDLTTGTGRFNLTRGAVGLISTIGASVSTTVSGFIAQELGRQAAFWSMGAVAGAGTLIAWLMLRESKPEKYID